MGLTVGCAQCHDHKYDPITQKEFYRLYAFFNNVPESGLDGNKGNAVPLHQGALPGAGENGSPRPRSELAALEAKLRGPLPDVDAAQADWEKQSRRRQDRVETAGVDQASLEGRGDVHHATRTAPPWSAGRSRRPRSYTFTFRTDLRAPDRDAHRGAARRHARGQGARPLVERELRPDRRPHQPWRRQGIDAAQDPVRVGGLQPEGGRLRRQDSATEGRTGLGDPAGNWQAALRRVRAGRAAGGGRQGRDGAVAVQLDLRRSPVRPLPGVRDRLAHAARRGGHAGQHRRDP